MYLIVFYTILLYSHFLPIICRGLPSFLLKYSIKISHRSKASLKGDIGNGSVCSYQQFFCPANPDKIKKCIRYNQVVPHPTWFGRKEMFEHLNGYRKIPLCEDYDFTLRALLKGYRVSNLNKVVLAGGFSMDCRLIAAVCSSIQTYELPVALLYTPSPTT